MFYFSCAMWLLPFLLWRTILCRNMCECAVKAETGERGARRISISVKRPFFMVTGFVKVAKSLSECPGHFVNPAKPPKTLHPHFVNPANPAKNLHPPLCQPDKASEKPHPPLCHPDKPSENPAPPTLSSRQTPKYRILHTLSR